MKPRAKIGVVMATVILVAFFSVQFSWAQEKKSDETRSSPWLQVRTVEVTLKVSGAYDFMALVRGWPTPKDFEKLFRETLMKGLSAAAIAVNPDAEFNLVCTAEFSWVTMMSFGGGFQPQYAEAYLSGSLDLLRGTEKVNSIGFKGQNLLVEMDPKFIENLCNVAVAEIVAALPDHGINPEKCEKFIWELRDHLPRKFKRTLIKRIPDAKPGEPAETSLIVPEPGSTLWKLLLKTKTVHSVSLVLDGLNSPQDEVRLAAAKALEKAGSDKEFRDVIKRYHSKIEELAQKQAKGEVRTTIENLLRTLE